jgi:nifR3 family TIM-barrel protein
MNREKSGIKALNEPVKGFWQGFSKPLFVLAPMANVTDVAFRTMFAKYGKPDVVWTEFVSADGLCSPGRKTLLRDLEFSKEEKPIVAQLFTSNPQKMKEAAKLMEDLGFDGIDINMGCPDRSVEKQGSGAAHLKDPKNAKEVIEAARTGAPSIPITVKTRIGYNKIEIDTWIRFLLEQNLPVLTVHLRTRKEMSDVPAHWELIPQIVKLRDEISPSTLIIGNGDVMSMEEGKKRIEETGCDGVMIGRGIFGNPLFFTGKTLDDIKPEERLNLMLEHARLFDKKLGDIKNFAIMKKHFKAYVSGWDGAKELRIKLMEVENIEEVEKIVKEYIKMLK